VEIAARLDREVQERVTGQRLQHVIEEPDAGLDVGLTPAVQIDPDAEIGLLCLATYVAYSWHV
jgi:hypothetical protein